MKMVEYIDRLTFGPSLNESENPVNNFFPLPSLLFTGPEELFSLWPAGERGEPEKKNFPRPPRWDGSLIHRIYFAPPSGKELESGWMPQISSFKRDSSTLITSSTGQPFWLKRPWEGTSEKLQAALKYHRGRAGRGRTNSCQAAIGHFRDTMFSGKKQSTHMTFFQVDDAVSLHSWLAGESLALTTATGQGSNVIDCLNASDRMFKLPISQLPFVGSSPDGRIRRFVSYLLLLGPLPSPLMTENEDPLTCLILFLRQTVSLALLVTWLLSLSSSRTQRWRSQMGDVLVSAF